MTPNATVRANARPMPDEPKTSTPEAHAARDRYEAAYSEWLAAKSAVYDPTADESDFGASRRYERLYAAPVALIATPAPLGWAVLQKLEFVEGLIAHEFDSGRPAYPLTVLALASVKADALSIGFKEG